MLENQTLSAQAGVVAYHNLNVVNVPDPETGEQKCIALKRNGEVAINDDKGRELERYKVAYGSEVLVKEGSTVKAGQPLVGWDPHLTPILAEVGGFVRFQDIAEGETVRLEQERAGAKYVVIEHKGDKHPQIIARCVGAADVIDAVNFAREHELLVAVRGGGHNVAGNAVCDDVELPRFRGELLI